MRSVCEWDVKKAHNCKRQFSDKLLAKLLLYFKQITKLGTLTLKASARFFARRKKPWLAEAANCSLLQEVLLQPQKNVLILKLSKELS